MSVYQCIFLSYHTIREGGGKSGDPSPLSELNTSGSSRLATQFTLGIYGSGDLEPASGFGDQKPHTKPQSEVLRWTVARGCSLSLTMSPKNLTAESMYE